MAEPTGVGSGTPAAAARRCGPSAWRKLRLVAALAALALLPLALALTDAHLAAGLPALVISTAAGVLAVSALVLQPLLVARLRPSAGALARRQVGWHRALGTIVLALVLVHVGALFVLEVDDTLFALSPDGPTRGRMALLATIALLGVVALGATRGRLRLSDSSWRILHAYLGVLVIVLGVGHAVLTDGALDGAGTPVLLVLGVAALVALAWAHATRPRGLPSKAPPRARPGAQAAPGRPGRGRARARRPRPRP